MTDSPTPQEQPTQPQQPDSPYMASAEELAAPCREPPFCDIFGACRTVFCLAAPGRSKLARTKNHHLSFHRTGHQGRVERVDIEFFDNVVLEGLYIEDLNGDTLLIADKFSAGLSGNFFSILWNRLEFREISLTHGRVHLRKMADQRRGNLNELLYRIGDLFGAVPSKTKKKQTPFLLKFRISTCRMWCFLRNDIPTERERFAAK